jgi:hypothetical protein
MAGMIFPVLEITSYNDTPSLAVTGLPSIVNSIAAASTSGFVAGFKPIPRTSAFSYQQSALS